MTKKEFKDYIEAASRNAARSRERMPPDWVEAHIALIDALRNFLWADNTIAKELLDEDAITLSQYMEGKHENKQLEAILKKMEDHGVDPTLRGVIPQKLDLR
jgi:hypothetical protein